VIVRIPPEEIALKVMAARYIEGSLSLGQFEWVA
jgi:hypothetical protein